MKIRYFSISKFQETGLLSRLAQKYMVQNIPPDEVYTQVSLLSITPLLMLIVGGIIIGLIFLIIEKIYYQPGLLIKNSAKIIRPKRHFKVKVNNKIYTRQSTNPFVKYY